MKTYIVLSINYKETKHKVTTLYSENELRSFLMKENERYDKTVEFFNTYVQEDQYEFKNSYIDIDNIDIDELIEIVCYKGTEISKSVWGVCEVLIL
jgi:hypothetical protein